MPFLVSSLILQGSSIYFFCKIDLPILGKRLHLPLAELLSLFAATEAAKWFCTALKMLEVFLGFLLFPFPALPFWTLLEEVVFVEKWPLIELFWL